MVRPGAQNLITDVTGLRVGHAEDHKVRTGTTVLVADEAFLAVCDVRGGAPGSRELEVLDPTNLVGRADAIVLSGGSVHGLDAASGVAAALRANGRGFRMSPAAPPAPIVPEAVLFALVNGGDKEWCEQSPTTRWAVQRWVRRVNHSPWGMRAPDLVRGPADTRVDSEASLP
jgi:D-aminopeptidase